MIWFFIFFFISGFCSILYELVWLRLAMAQFGVTTALVSIVLSVFMAGLGAGSWISGRHLRRNPQITGKQALRFYAAAELLIGISAVLVPYQLVWGRHLLERTELTSSLGYYCASGLWLALTLIPWCACMGATIPIGMQAIHADFRQESPRAFSFLYLANVLGAVAGASIPLLLIEALGFHGTLRVGAILNALLAVSAAVLALRRSGSRAPDTNSKVATQTSTGTNVSSPALLALLFATGLTSMGMEVVWIREYTPYLTTVVYAFASILGVYLLSTFAGSRIYRYWSLKNTVASAQIWMLLGVLALLPMVATTPKTRMWSAARLLIGVAPFSMLLGFVTPMLVDRWSRGDPDRAGTAYAVNIAGCILGPLLAGFLLLPLISERWVLFIFSLPWLAVGLAKLIPTASAEGVQLSPRKEQLNADHKSRNRQVIVLSAYVAAVLLLLIFGKDYQSRFHQREVLRDNTATIIATGTGMEKSLLVNGVGITTLTPITKMMAHLPLASLDHSPRNALDICFGMGTTFRSLLSWKIQTTAVDLVPSVPRMFWYFHSDARELVRLPFAHIVIDDGRRYLERTREQYDVITIDPPPPVEAAGSSLLYSKEFYAALKPRLRPDGILQQWLPEGDHEVRAAVARSLKESFPYVRVFFVDPAERWGIHFLASMQPLHDWTPAELVHHMPASAQADLIEWDPQTDAESQFQDLMGNESTLDGMIEESPSTPALQDDRPVNEYYLERRYIFGNGE